MFNTWIGLFQSLTLSIDLKTPAYNVFTTVQVKNLKLTRAGSVILFLSAAHVKLSSCSLIVLAKKKPFMSCQNFTILQSSHSLTLSDTGSSNDLWILIFCNFLSCFLARFNDYTKKFSKSRQIYKFLYLQSHCEGYLKGFFYIKNVYCMYDELLLILILGACEHHERVFDWVIKNENWWPEFILNSCWGLSKDLHNFHQLHLHGKIFSKVLNISRFHISRKLV